MQPVYHPVIPFEDEITEFVGYRTIEVVSQSISTVPALSKLAHVRYSPTLCPIPVMGESIKDGGRRVLVWRTDVII